MILSKSGKELIKGFESLSLVPYKDTGGVWTWGYGHAKGPHENIPSSVTLQEAEDIFTHDVSYTEKDVTSILHNIDVPQNTFDALVSFVFNVGITQLRALPHRTLTAIENHNWGEVSKLMLTWCHDNGKYVQGLYNRRVKEVEVLNGN